MKSIIPTIAYPRKRCVKNKAPKIIVHSGESVFKIPANELFNFVCAKAKRNAGKKTPINPDRNNLKGSPGFISFNRGKANGNKKIAAAVTRNAPTVSGENTFSPCLMRMNDVPQMSDKMSSRNKAEPFFLFSVILVKRLLKAA